MSYETRTRYVITFDRIGRNRHVAPLEADAADGDHLAEEIYRYARPHLVSLDVEVHVDLAERKGLILCGVLSGGAFTIELPAEAWV